MTGYITETLRRFDEEFCFEDPINGKKLFTNMDQTQEIKHFLTTELQAYGELVRAEEREKIRKSVELWMDVHERDQKTFTTDDFIKFVTEEL